VIREIGLRSGGVAYMCALVTSGTGESDARAHLLSHLLWCVRCGISAGDALTIKVACHRASCALECLGRALS